MEELAKVTTYQEYKQAMDTELRKSTESFVRIGYLLKLARDTDILKESGYGNVNDFAQGEYNIDKTQVSRFIHINDRFSEGGYSDRLKEQYKNFGHAKLTIMLQLPDELNEELTPEYSKTEIQALKEEIDAEKEITDIEVILEGEDAAQQSLDTNMAKALHQLFRENPELFSEVHKVLSAGLAAVQDVLAPSGTQIYSVRPQGIGRLMLSLKTNEDKVSLVNARSGEKEVYAWMELLETLQRMINTENTVKEDWERIYGEAYPEQQKKEEVAPVQPQTPAKQTEKKPEAKKKSRVSKAAVNKKPAKPEQEKEKPEEQLEGQMDIEQYPEVLPDNETETVTGEIETENNEIDTGSNETETEITETPQNTPEQEDAGEEDASELDKRRRAYREKFYEAMNLAKLNETTGMYLHAVANLRDAIEQLQALDRLEAEEE
ncbi:MAG: hypothetical protein ACI4FZ_08855 [Lachnospiraceae bacterium]